MLEYVEQYELFCTKSLNLTHPASPTHLQKHRNTLNFDSAVVAFYELQTLPFIMMTLCILVGISLKIDLLEMIKTMNI